MLYHNCLSYHHRHRHLMSLGENLLLFSLDLGWIMVSVCLGLVQIYHDKSHILGNSLKSESHSVVSNSLWPQVLYSPWNSPDHNTSLQGIFPTQGSSPDLLRCRQILYHLRQQGSPRILESVAYPFSSRSSWPRNWTLLHFRWILYQLTYQGSSSPEQIGTGGPPD